MDDRIETGSCFCGAISAEMRGDPFWISYDYYDDCRAKESITNATWTKLDQVAT